MRRFIKFLHQIKLEALINLSIKLRTLVPGLASISVFCFLGGTGDIDFFGGNFKMQSRMTYLQITNFVIAVHRIDGRYGSCGINL